MSLLRKLKRKKQKRKHPVVSLSSPKEILVNKEANYIVQCAIKGDGRSVAIGSFVLFSTCTGDAWILDPRENLALCLAADFEKKAYRIIEDKETFAIEWDSNFELRNDVFCALKNDKMQFYFDYPVSEIRYVIENLTF